MTRPISELIRLWCATAGTGGLALTADEIAELFRWLYQTAPGTVGPIEGETDRVEDRLSEPGEAGEATV